MAFLLPVGLGLVAALFVLIVGAEVFYLFYWRKRPSPCPRLNNVTVAPVNEGEQVEVGDESRAAVMIDVTCAEYQISTLQQDLVEKLFPSLSSTSHEAVHHTMVGPPRMLFTIKEETKEELEGLDTDAKWAVGRSRRSSRSKSMGDIPFSPPGASPFSPGATPFATPSSSPDVFSSPCGTPTRSLSPLVPLSSQSQSHPISASPSLLKTSCTIVYDYPTPKSIPNPTAVPISPPLAPPSPTRPTFSFLASRNVTVSYNRSSSTGNLVRISSSMAEAPYASANPAPSPPVRKPLFQHLASSSPIHKQAECVIKVPSPLRTCTYENDDDDDNSSVPSLSSVSSSPDRSPNVYSTPTPSFDPISIQGLAEILVAPSSKGSDFNRRQGANTFSPLSSPSDGDSPYASPLLVFPSQSEGGEAEGEFQTSTARRGPASIVLSPSDGQEIVKEETFAPPAATALLREVVMPRIVLPTPFSFQYARSKAQCAHPTALEVSAGEFV